MAGVDNSKHRAIEKVAPTKDVDGQDNLHQDPKQAYKEHTDLGKQIKQTTDGWVNALAHLAHPTDQETQNTVQNQRKFANAYYKNSAGKLIESVTSLITDGIKFVGHQQDAARTHDPKLAWDYANPIKPVAEAIGGIPKIAQQLNDLKPHDVLNAAKTPEGLGAILGGVVFVASQLELPGGNKLKELSSVGKLEEDARKKFGFLKTIQKTEEVTAEANVQHSVKIQLKSGKEIEALETRLPDGAIQRKFTDTKGGKAVEITQTKDAEKTITEWEGNKVTQFTADKRKVHEKPDGSIETTFRDGRKETKTADGKTLVTYEKPIPMGAGENLPGEGEVIQPHTPKMPTEAEIGRDLEKEGLVKLGSNGRYEQTENNCWDIAGRLAQLFGYEAPSTKAGMIKLAEAHLGRRAGFRPNLAMPKEGACLIVREIPGNLSEPMHITFASGGQEYNFGVTKNDNHNIRLRIPLAKIKT